MPVAPSASAAQASAQLLRQLGQNGLTGSFDGVFGQGCLVVEQAQANPQRLAPEALPPDMDIELHNPCLSQ